LQLPESESLVFFDDMHSFKWYSLRPVFLLDKYHKLPGRLLVFITVKCRVPKFHFL